MQSNKSIRMYNRSFRSSRDHSVPKTELKAVPSKVVPMVVDNSKEVHGGNIYDPKRFPHIVETLCREYGMTDEQLCGIFGCTESEFRKWKRKHEDFTLAIIRGRDEFDGMKVENALLKRALGYNYTEKQTKTTMLKGRDKDKNITVYVPAVETTIIEKEMPADIKAIMFWLTNRNKERWQMVTTVNANINAKTEHVKKTLNVSADLSKMDVEQLKALREMVSAQSQGMITDETEEDKNIDWIEGIVV
jgi:hypothetical protein